MTVLDYTRTASPVSAGHLIKASDWAVLQPGGNGTVTDGGWSTSNLAYNAAGGSLGSGTAHCKITYVTAQGETTPSSDVTVSISSGSGAFTITFPVLPSATSGSPEINAAPILGWRVYSASSTTTLLNATTDFDSTTQGILKTIVTTQGSIANVIPITATTAQVQVYGTGAGVPVVNRSGIQQPLPSITANSSTDVFLVVNRQFKTQKEVNWIRPNSSADAAGVAPALMDCVAPLWAASTAYSAGSFITVGQIVFWATTGGTSASSIPAGLGTTRTKGSTVTDNTVTWTCLGEGSLVRSRFVNMTGSAAQPIAQEYDLFQA